MGISLKLTIKRMYRMLDVYLMREAQLEEIRHFHD